MSDEKPGGEEFNFRHGEEAHGFWWLNAKADFDDYRKSCKEMQVRSQVNFDNLCAVHTDMARKLMESHASHVNDLNKEKLADIHAHRVDMRHALDRLMNLNPEEAVAMGEILDQPQKAAIEAIVIAKLNELIDKK